MWKDVVGYEGLYRVSDDGRIRTVARWVNCRAPRGGFRMHWVNSCMLKPSIGKHGCKVVKLYNRGRNTGRQQLVHRLVLEAFVGPCPSGMECCHWDGNAGNNKLKNLRWDTPKANAADRERHGTHPKGSDSGKAKLTEADIPYIRSRKTKKRGVMSAVAREFRVNAATIRDIWVGKTWQHVR